jgi:hypothetical protein
MSRKERSEQLPSADRRTFLSGASALGSTAAQAEVKFPKEPGKFGSGGTGSTPANAFAVQVNRSENTFTTVKLPYRAAPQVHGFWVPGDQLPAAG